MGEEWRIEVSATHRLGRTAVIGVTITRARGGEFWRYGIEQEAKWIQAPERRV
jgi:hypothetical protein